MGGLGVKKTTKEVILDSKIIVICRGIHGRPLLDLVGALAEGGLDLVVVTFEQSAPECLERTANAIRAISDTFGSRVRPGAGTVLSTEQVKAARDAGAEYVISPNVDPDVIAAAKRAKLISIPGAMT